MRHWITVIAVLFSILPVSAQINLNDSTSTDWGEGPGVDINPNKPTGKVTQLSLSSTRLLLSGGETARLVAIVNSDATNKTVTWRVADAGIASVSSSGLVTALTTGQTVVTATSVDGGLTAQCVVTVKNNAMIYVERIELDKTELTMYVGETYLLNSTVYPENATNKGITWEQRGYDQWAERPILEYYNPASIDAQGIITAVTPGTMNLRCWPDDGSAVEAICKVTVKDRPVTSLSLPSNITLKRDEVRDVVPTVVPELKQMKFKWSVANPEVAYINSSGRITGVKPGSTTVTVTSLDGTNISATSTVTVTNSTADWGYSGWVLEQGETVNQWTALCFHQPGYQKQTPPDDSKGASWYSLDYDDSEWEYTYGPLKNHIGHDGGGWHTGFAQWDLMDGTSLSIRQKFYLPEVEGYDFDLYARVYENSEIYLNGKRIYITDVFKDYTEGSYTAALNREDLIFGGINIIAIVGFPGEDSDWSSQYMDFGLHYEKNVPVTRIILSEKELTIPCYKSKNLTAITKPANASRPTLSWSSSNESIATVSSTGRVKALSVGTAYITATATDGSGISVQCKVTVEESTSGSLGLPKVDFEFNYNARDYKEDAHCIPNNAEAELAIYNLQLSENIPEYNAKDGYLDIQNICCGWIDKWERESWESGNYFYRSGQDDMTIVCKVAPKFNGTPGDFISNRAGGYNYMLRIGDNGRFFLHTAHGYSDERSLEIQEDTECILAVRVNGSENYILLENLTTGESQKFNYVYWGDGDNALKFFYNDWGEFYTGKFFWAYYSKEYLTDDEVESVSDYNELYSGTLVGDVNGDGKVTIADLPALINIQLINQQITNKKADVNGDGNVNIDDIHVLRDILLEKTK